MDALKCAWCEGVFKSATIIKSADGSYFCNEGCKGFYLTDEMLNKEAASDPINHPKHYTEHPSGVECITITEHMSFTLGNAIKYIWRADLKNGVEDLKKAIWYLNRELKRRENGKH